MATDLTQVQRGQRWQNRHTGRVTTVTSVGVETVARPTRLGQAHDGRLLFGGYEDRDEVLVHHTANVAPGFKRGAGDSIDSFLEHWMREAVPEREETDGR